jgi:hypothetical protein
MGIFEHKYTTEGYYTYDEMGNLIMLFSIDEINDAMECNMLFYCDGYSISIVNSSERSKRNRFDDMI